MSFGLLSMASSRGKVVFCFFFRGRGCLFGLGCFCCCCWFFFFKQVIQYSNKELFLSNMCCYAHCLFTKTDENGEIKKEDRIIITRRKRDDRGPTAFVKWHGIKDGSGQTE